METLVVVAQHRNHQYYSKSRSHGPGRYGSFGSLPNRDFRDINCRTFQSGGGILPTPLNVCTTPVTKREISSPPLRSYSEDNWHLKKSVKSNTISIPIDVKVDFDKKRSFGDELYYSERWAGPAYSNSPPPSSLPIPKFSIRPKRTVSLDLPGSVSDGDMHPIAKSAPPSPTREHGTSSRDFFHSADSATKTLRRILNLDLTDE
ncbi:hypothetical protein RJ639_020701 [Escallonia herrerae]|uniref:Uncharacterized protein n=1 Tax=Escallonia herrerae TaxID=1293975 RepID=A0AA89AGM6_9ASTE|nr:hypothetical protein RJ639_020701 [Escallonia herrerae]